MRKMYLNLGQGAGEILTRDELKGVLGGQGSYNLGSVTRMSCHCTRGSNPPFLGSWIDYYVTTQQIIDDISRRCANGGTCREAPYYG